MKTVKTKVTLSVDKSLVSFGKEYAARHATSLSGILEDTLRDRKASEQPTFAQKWRGKLKKAHRPGDARMRALEKKYG